MNLPTVSLNRPLLSAILLALTGCSSMAPDYQTPTIATPAQFAGYAVLKPIEQLRQTPHPSAWWQSFNDPLLNELNERLTLDNQNLKASEAQYRIALATLQSVSASRLPSLNASFSASHGTLASTTSFSSSELPKVTTYSLSTNVAWELDV